MKPTSSPAAFPIKTSFTRRQLALVKLNSNSAQWPKQSSPRLEVPTYNARGKSGRSTHQPRRLPRLGSENECPAGSRVYSSLQRPTFLMGGEASLSLINSLFGVGFFGYMAFMKLDWHWLIGALFFAGPVQWIIRLMAKIDAQYSEVQPQAVFQPSVFEPHGYVDIPARKLRRLITKG
jgi:type IV secretory pathway TrbD component